MIIKISREKHLPQMQRNVKVNSYFSGAHFIWYKQLGKGI